MGFRPEPTTIKLNFRDTDLDGLEVVMRSMPVKQYNQMLASAAATGLDFLKANDKVFDDFCSHLVSWNIEDDEGQPVPATRDSVENLESNLFTRMVAAWQQGLTAVPTRRQPPSSNGSLPSRSEESTLGLGNLSESPGS